MWSTKQDHPLGTTPLWSERWRDSKAIFRREGQYCVAKPTDGSGPPQKIRSPAHESKGFK